MNSKLVSGFISKVKKINPSLASVKKLTKTTQKSVEQKIESVVGNLLSHNLGNPITEEERKEVVSMLFAKFHSHNYVPSFEYINNVLKKQGQNSLKTVLQFKKNVAKNIVDDARNRIKSRIKSKK